jgi:hypothetical protein
MGREPVDTVEWSDESLDSLLQETSARPKPLLLGLPCSRCGAYYECELTTCPLCGCQERIKPDEPSAQIHLSRAA